MKEKIFKVYCLINAIIASLFLFIIILFLFKNGMHGIEKIGFVNFITGKIWQPGNNIYGILPMIIASLLITTISILLAAPVAISGAVFIKYYCPKRFIQFFKQIINLLVCIPSIVYGFFALIVLVPLIQNINGSGKGIMTASFILAIMIIPTILNIVYENLNQVNKQLLSASIALGASLERSIFKIILPSIKSGVVTSIILGIGRAIGETMAVVMVLGNQAIIPESLFSGARSLTANIILEMGYAEGLHREMLISSSLVLFIFIMIINLIAGALKNER